MTTAAALLQRLAAALALGAIALTLPTAARAQSCSVADLNIGGVVNTYWAGTGTVAAGATSVTLGAMRTGTDLVTGLAANTTAFAPGDEILLIQMQDADINTTATDAYGDGVAGAPYQGYTNLNNTGNFHFAKVVTAGATVTFTPAVPAGMSFRTAAAVAGSNGQRTFQVVRVPYSRNVNVNSTLRALSWNGSTGAVVAVEAGQNLTMNAGVDAAGVGFRGGGGHRGNNFPTGTPGADAGVVPAESYTGALPGGTATSGRASKGEGIAGTPRLVDQREIATLTYGYTTFDRGTEGYPYGAGTADFGRGAPGNAGGGGNRHDSGGGGGGNAGAGGKGGGAYSDGTDWGGYGGGAITGYSGTRLFLGGGGGSGQGYHNPPTTGTIPTLSGGARGGGIVILRADVISGSASITVKGAAGFGMPTNLGGCNFPLSAGVLNGLGGEGGGAGGSAQLIANSSGLASLSVDASGGNGGNAGHCGINVSGPGGAGGGGLVVYFTNGAAPAINTAGGVPGNVAASDAQPGAANASNPPGGGAGGTNPTLGTAPPSACSQPDLTIAKTIAGNITPGQSGATYSLVVTNSGSGPKASPNTVTVTDTAMPAGFTATAIAGTGWTCVLGTLTCTRTDALAAGASYPPITLTFNVPASAPGNNSGIVQNTATVALATQTESNAANNSVTTDTYVTGLYKSVRVTADPDGSGLANPTVGDTLTWSVFVSNPLGAAAIASFQVDDALPAGVAITAAGAQTITQVNGACGTLPTKNAAYTGAGNNGLIAGAQTLPANCTLRIDIPTTVTTAGAKSNQATLSGTGITAASSDAIDNTTAAASLPTGVAAGANSLAQVQAAGTRDPTIATISFPAPTIAKSFVPAAVSPGNTTVLTIVITNTGAAPLTTVAFTDNYPAGLVNGTSPNGTSSCGGTVTAVAGASSLALSGATVPAAGTCTITANVTITGTGTYTNTIAAGALASGTGVTNTAAATATLYTHPTIAKSFSPTAVAPGANSVMTIAITNPNTAALTFSNPALTDNFPAGLVASGGAVTGTNCGAFAPNVIAANATSYQLTAGSIAAGATCTLTFTVKSAVAGIYNNTTSGVTTTTTGTAGPVSNTASLGVGLVSLAKAFGPAQIATGGTSTITYTLTNPSATPQTGGQFLDTMVNMAISGAQSAGGTCTYSPAAPAFANGATSLNFTGINIPASGSCTVTVLITSSNVGTNPNAANGVTTALLPQGPGSNTDNLVVIGKPTIAKAFAPSTINPNGTSTLTFTLTNPNSIALTGVSFTDAYPGTLRNATPLATGGSCAGVTTTAVANGANFNVTAATIPANASCTITVDVTSAAAGSFANTTSGVASTQSGAAGAASNTATLIVAASATIAKAFVTSPIAQGGNSVITFTISNPNTSALTNLAFTDALVNMTVSSTTIGGTCVGTTNTPALLVGATSLNLSIPSLAASSSCTVQVTVTSSTSGTLPNTSSGVTATQSPVAGPASNTANLVVLAPPTISKTFVTPSIQAGGTSVLRFTITNPQATPLNNVTFADPLVNMTLSVATFTETCAGTVSFSPALSAGGTQVNPTLSQLAASETCTIDVTVTSTSSSNAGGHVNATGPISSTETPSGGGTATASLVVMERPVVTKTFAPNAVSAGVPTLLTFVVTNPNPVALTGVAFTDVFPTSPGAMTLSATAGNLTNSCGGTVQNSAGGALATGSVGIRLVNGSVPASGSCTITVNVQAPSVGQYTNNITLVSSTQTPASGAGGSDVLNVADLNLTKQFCSNLPPATPVGATCTPVTDAVVGTVFNMWITVNNPTGTSNSDLFWTDNLPAGMVTSAGDIFVSRPAGNCVESPNPIPNEAGNAATFNFDAARHIDTLNGNQTCIISVPVTTTTAGVKTNTINGVSSTPLPANAFAGTTDTVSMRAWTPPTLAKAFTPATIGIGGTSVLRVTLTNPAANPGAVTGVIVTDVFPTSPAAMTLANATTANTCGGSLTDSGGGSLNAGDVGVKLSGATIPQNGTCYFEVTVTAPSAGTYANTIAAGGLTTSVAGSNAAAATANLVVTGAALTKAFSPATIQRGTVSRLTFTVTNAAGNPAQPSIAFTDNLPGGVVVASPANAATTCTGATVTAAPGGGTITLAGGTMNAGTATCVTAVDVTSAATAAYVNNSTNISGASAGLDTSAVNATLTVQNNAALTKAFNPVAIGANGTSVLTFTITNGAGAGAYGGQGFTDTLPAGVVVATTPGVVNGCGGTVTAAASSNTISLANGNIGAAPATCTIAVNVTAASLGNYTNNASNISGLAGGLTAAGVNATVQVVGTALTKTFNPTVIGRTGVSQVTFTITNGAGNPAQSGLAFIENLPANLFVAPTPGVVNSCGGTVTAAPNAGTIDLAAGTLGVGVASCAITVNVTSSFVGSYFNGPARIVNPSATMDVSGVNATLTVAENPAVGKTFTPNSVALSTNSLLTITLTNANAIAITGVAFTDTLPGTVLNSPQPPNPANSCGGTLTAAAGANTVSLSGGTIPANGTCAITVNVRSATAGSFNNTIGVGAVTSTNAGANPVAASAQLDVLAPITVAKAYSPNPVAINTASTLTITLTNPNAFAAATGAAFIDTNPVGVTNTNTGATTCGGTVTATVGGTTVQLAGGTVPAGGSCTVTIQQQATAGGAYANVIPIGDVTTTNAGANTVAANATLNAYAPPTISKAFGGPIGPGGSTTLTFTITNPAANPGAVSGIGFTDVFPVGPAAMTLFDTTVANACAGSTLTDSGAGALNAGDVGVAASNISLNAGASCTIAVNVTAPTAGSYVNTSGAVTATTPVALTGGTAGATLTVAQPTLTKVFNPTAVTVGGTTTLVFTLTNAAGNPAQSGLSFTDTLPAGLAVAATPNFQSSCPAGGALLNNPAFLSAPGGVITVANAAMNATVATCEIRVNVTPSATVTAGACPQPNNTNSSTNIGGLARLTNGVAPQCATVTAAVPVLDKAFSGALVVGGTASLTFTISQPANNPVQTFSFTDNLPAGIVVDAGGASGTCTGGSVTAASGATSIQVTNRQVSGASCTIVVPVRAAAAPTPALCPAANNTNGNGNIASPTNITAAIANSAAGGGSSTTGACVTVIARPTVTKAYGPNPIVAGGTTTLTITLGNTNPAVAITGVGFTDTNPVGVLNTTTPTVSNSCGGTLTANGSANSVALAGGTIPANGSCVITVTQSAAAAGSYPNTIAIGDVTSANAGSNAVAANATLDAYSPPAISKVFAPTTIGPGGTSTLTFTITNPAGNTQALTGVAFTDALPVAPGAMRVAAVPAASTTNCGAPTFAPAANDATLTFSGGSIAVGGTCTVAVDVTAATPGAYTNTSGAVSATGPMALTGNTATAPLTVSQASLGKIFAPATIDQGGVSTLTFTLTNGAGAPAQSGIAFTDNLPAGVVIATPNGLVSSCPSGTAGITATASTASIAVTGAALSLAQASCTIAVNVTSPTPGVYQNLETPNIVGAQRIATTGVAATLTVQVLPTLTKAFAAPTVPVGGTTTLVFTINNAAPGAVNRPGLAFTDTLPAGISIASPPVPTTNGQCGAPTYTAADASQPFTASGISVNAGQTCTITLTIRGVTAGVATNGNGNVTTTGVANGVSNQSITVVAAPTIAKAFGTPTIAADGTSTITFTLTNPNATLPLTAAGFTDTLTAMQVASPGGAAGGTCTGAASNSFATGATALAFTGLTIPAAGSCTVTVVVTSDVPGPHNNQASGVSSAESATGPVSNVAVLTVTAATPTIAKAFGTSPIALGGTSALTFTITNTNGVALTGAAFTDTLTGMSIASPGGAATGTCTGAGANSFATGATALAFSGLTVPANGSCTVAVVVTSSTPGAKPNTASGVSSNEAATGAVSNTATLTVTAVAPTVTKAFNLATISSGGTSTLTITIGNPNAAAITVTSITDTFPTLPAPGLVRAATPNASTNCAGGAVGSTAGSVTLTGGTVPANGSCTFQIDVLATNSGSYLNTIAAGALTTSAGASTAPASATLTVNAVANLAVVKTGPASVATGGAISYTVTVSNAGPDAANGASFADTVPAAVTGVGASCVAAGGAACGAANVAGNAVTSTITTLPAGGSVTFTITGTATGAAAVTNTATIAPPAGVSDPNNANNSSSVTTTVLAPDLTLAKAHAGNFTIGANGTFTITVSNGGTAPTSGVVTMTDPLPAGLGFVSAAGTGWACGFAAGTVTCTTSNAIAPASAAPAITLVVSVAAVAAPAVNNIASVAGGNEPAALANNNIGSDNALVVAGAVNSFAPNNAQTALPGTVVFYPHTYTAGVAGNLTFGTSAVLTPAMGGWTQIVYRDANCNGILDGAEGAAAPLTAAVAVNPGDVVCIVVKDSIPANAPYNSVAAINVTATNGAETLTLRDVTTVGAVAGAGLTLSKTVRNVTQGGAATTSGSARPDDVLEYTITYTNASSGILSAIVVTDATPAFTVFVSAACPAPPPNLTGCTVTAQPAVGGTGSVVWTLAGSMISNASGSVSYQVRVLP